MDPWNKTLSTTNTVTLNFRVQPDDVVVCTASATDSCGDIGSNSATVTVENTAPVVSTVVITPASAVKTNTTLTCAATASDADGGSPSLSYRWTSGSAVLGNTNTLALTPGTSAPGDVIECLATATDLDGGSGTGSAAVTVGNTEPVIDRIEIRPSTALYNDSVTCVVNATDLDGGVPTITYAWTAKHKVPRSARPARSCCQLYSIPQRYHSMHCERIRYRWRYDHKICRPNLGQSCAHHDRSVDFTCNRCGQRQYLNLLWVRDGCRWRYTLVYIRMERSG